MVRHTEGRPMLVSYPHRVVTYVSDEQLAAIRACIAREPYRYPSISRLICQFVGEALAARDGGDRAGRPRARSRRRRRRT
jgi:hypothetical protein